MLPPESVQLAFFVVQEAIKVEPAIAAELQRMFNKGVPSEADWAALRAKVANKTYRDYVPDSALPADETSQ